MNRHARQLFYFGWGNLAPVFNPLAQAVAILTKYGGSLWVADPAYTFTGSDGTGAAGDNSDTGYVRDLCGNARPLTQATTGFKPKLKRVPKKLGPELAPATTSTTGWAAAGGGVISSDGTALTITNGAAAEGRAQFAAAFKANTSYAVSLEVTALVNGGSGAFIIGSTRVALGGLGSKSLMLTPTIAAAEGRVAPNSGTLGDGITFKNISVREVLEWGWAWVFDGTDDLLATVSQPAAASETLIVAKRLFVLPPSTRTAMAKAGTNTGVELYANASVYNNSQIGTGSGYVYKSYQGTVGTSVHSAVVTPTSRQIRVNGSSAGVEAITFASAAATIKVGGGTAAFNGEIFAAAYIPGAPTDAEMLIIERAMGQVGGIAI